MEWCDEAYAGSNAELTVCPHYRCGFVDNLQLMPSIAASVGLGNVFVALRSGAAAAGKKAVQHLMSINRNTTG